MNSVFLKIYRQAELSKRNVKKHLELLKRQNSILSAPVIEQNVYKKVGLWNMDDLNFYDDSNVYEKLLCLERMFLSFQLLNIQYVNLLDATCDYYRGITEIPIVAITPDEFVFEFKAPFDKNLFQKLIDDECDILEFGNDYVKIHNNRCYATARLYDLFVHQPTAEVKRLRQRLCKI